jgi:hypothetical protein
VVSQGEFPKDVKAPTPYGPNIPALGVRLHEREGLPYARASALLRDLFGAAPAPATLEAAGKRMEAAVKAFNESVKAVLRQENVLGCHEMGRGKEGLGGRALHGRLHVHDFVRSGSHWHALGRLLRNGGTQWLE